DIELQVRHRSYYVHYTREYRLKCVFEIDVVIAVNLMSVLLFFFFNDPAPTEIYTLSLHDALPILGSTPTAQWFAGGPMCGWRLQDRKSTRLNSSHVSISYAVFCLKKKK